MSALLLTALARLFTTFLTDRGFTIGVEDILCVKKVKSASLHPHDRSPVRSGAEMSVLSLCPSVSQGALLGDFLPALACSIGKVVLREACSACTRMLHREGSAKGGLL